MLIGLAELLIPPLVASMIWSLCASTLTPSKPFGTVIMENCASIPRIREAGKTIIMVFRRPVKPSYGKCISTLCPQKALVP